MLFSSDAKEYNAFNAWLRCQGYDECEALAYSDMAFDGAAYDEAHEDDKVLVDRLYNAWTRE